MPAEVAGEWCSRTLTIGIVVSTSLVAGQQGSSEGGPHAPAWDRPGKVGGLAMGPAQEASVHAEVVVAVAAGTMQWWQRWATLSPKPQPSQHTHASLSLTCCSRMWSPTLLLQLRLPTQYHRLLVSIHRCQTAWCLGSRRGRQTLVIQPAAEAEGHVSNQNYGWHCGMAVDSSAPTLGWAEPMAGGECHLVT